MWEWWGQRLAAVSVSGLGGRALACPLPTLTASLWDLQDLLKEYYLGTPVSPVPLHVVLALEQLSKLKPSFGSEDMHDILTLCWKITVTHPSAEMMLKISKSQQAARYLQLLKTTVRALGRLMAVLLETEHRHGFFQNIVHVSMCGAREKASLLPRAGTELRGQRGRSEGEKSPADVAAHCELRNGQRNGPCRGKGRSQPLAGRS
ncbi:uncharacterized protein LOC110391289 [Numida meleagris]|uniref:uncharacterized protein LOC110391289 n=1 Tax=Numida meleagris TaxID=8996 RepID=UPI000B3DB2A8|nr:uncharacterized protein LOC110391289 [Numida meleagris]